PPPWVVKDNKWRATRYGLDARVITDAHGTTVPLRDDLYELVRDLRPTAARLGCAEDLDLVSEILDKGASYERQRAVVADGGSISDVVDLLVTELRSGDPTRAVSVPATSPAARSDVNEEGTLACRDMTCRNS